MTTPIDSASFPPEVRAAGAAGERLYEAALGFESVLLSQLASGLTDSLGGGGDDGGDAGTSLVGQLLPDALAQSVSAGGGTGLALELYRSLQERSA